jgi:hypothetical protein
MFRRRSVYQQDCDFAASVHANLYLDPYLGREAFRPNCAFKCPGEDIPAVGLRFWRSC